MNGQPYQTAIDQAMAVLDSHFKALNAKDESALIDTLHFPHYRLASGRLQTWPDSSPYLSDFYARVPED